MGTPQNKQCCSYSNGSSCCSSSFVLGVTGPAFKPGYDAIIQNLTSGLVNASSISSQQSNCTNTTSSGNGDLGTKVGVGVGVPLGVLVAGLLGFLFYREYKKGHQAQGGAVAVSTYDNNAQHSVMNNQTPNYTSGYTQDQTAMTPQQTLYSPQAPKPDPYNPASPVYEAPATNNVHEIGTR